MGLLCRMGHPPHGPLPNLGGCLDRMRPCCTGDGDARRVPGWINQQVWRSGRSAINRESLCSERGKSSHCDAEVTASDGGVFYFKNGFASSPLAAACMKQLFCRIGE